ncbi:MAG: hypothetical protein QOE08_400, partial [Thermoleophilaceae bacterium]|nr:hypothetical protein [Thermoleophilaceae bacterium]
QCATLRINFAGVTFIDSTGLGALIAIRNKDEADGTVLILEELRPTDKLRKLTRRQVRDYTRINKTLFKRCKFHEIQPAATKAKNNDRIVIMPGVYTEPTARKVPSLPPECDKYRVTSEKGKGAVSYAYHYNCPNAQNLIALIGRALGPGQDPPSSPTGRPDPHNIPNEGKCIRCNVQIEGSGPTPDDTIIDAGRVKSGDHAPLGSAKDVGLKVDRADGVVLYNFKARHAAEHDVYILETDGYLQDRLKLFYAGEYGTLMFTTDHGMTQNCDAVGSGDSGVYPGGAPDTGTLRDRAFYPEQRLNQDIHKCDIHHNNMGTSGTMGNSVHFYDNNIYDNASGFVTDSFYAGGHPGFPQDSTVYENNRVYSNNFDVYGPKSDVKSVTAVPIGVGALIAGGDANIVRHNYIYDNWRRGTMLLSVPDAISCAPNPDAGSPPCTPKGAATTSNDNTYTQNILGRTPAGQQMPNGVDFWWDEFPTNSGNCWPSNTGVDGTGASITSDPPRQPVAGTTLPGYLPEDCGSPVNKGQGDPAKESMLLDCAQNGNDGVCEWYQMPAKPGSAQAAQQQALNRQASQSLIGTPATGPLCTLIGGTGGWLTCEPFQRRLG